MRHVWGFATALGLLLFVIFGTWACLSAGGNEPVGSSLVLALVGVVLLVVGIVGRGLGSAAVLKARAVLGGLGLLLAAVTGFLTLLALFTDPASALPFLLVTIGALVAWAQSVALQVGLSIRVSLAWLASLLLFIGMVVAVAAVATTTLTAWLRIESALGARLVLAAVLGLVGTLVALWATGRPDRKAVFGAVGRAALGRREPKDVELLAAGPVPIFRSQVPDEPG